MAIEQKEVFQKEVSFLSKVPDLEAEVLGTMKLEPTKKTFTFLALNQTDKSQHKFHFAIAGYFGGRKREDGADPEDADMVFDGEAVYELVAKFIKKFTLVEGDISAQDKEEFMNDSGAIYEFALYVMKEKIIPFFLKLRQK